MIVRRIRTLARTVAGALACAGALAAAELPRADQELEVPDLAGTPKRPLALTTERLAVLIFAAHDCPISNRLAPEVRALCEANANRGVRCTVVYVDALASPNTLREHAAAHYGAGSQGGARGQAAERTTGALLDRSQILARALGVTVTPEATIVDRAGLVRYRGRINDRYVALGTARRQARRDDLRIALAELLAGQPVSAPETTAVGCALPPTRTKLPTARRGRGRPAAQAR